MKIYLSGVIQLKNKLEKKYKLNQVLTAFPELQHKDKNKEKKRIEKLQGIDDLFLDSGGFSIRNSGMDLSIIDYLEFIKKYGHLFSIITNMDTSDEEETWRNQKILEKSGHYIMPVYHYGDKGSLEELCKKYKHIGLGGMAGTNITTQKLENFLKYCFYIGTKYKVKFHGFGMTSFPLLKKYPFYSVDSTSWLAMAKFNNILIFKNGKPFTSNASKMRDKFGIDFGKLSTEEKFILGYGERLKLRDYITNLHKAKKMDYRNY